MSVIGGTSGMRDRRAQWTIGLVMLLLGFLAIVQLRAQGGGSSLASLTSQDLTSLIANLNQRNDQLSSEVAALDAQLEDLQLARARGRTSIGDLEAELRTLRLLAGLDPVQGRGVVVSCSGPISAAAVGDLLNDLRAAGAEALAVEDVRVVAGTVVAGPDGALSVENDALPASFEISAIGNPVNLSAALTRVGGVVSRIKVATPDVDITVAPADSLTLPATTRDLQPVDAKPHV